MNKPRNNRSRGKDLVAGGVRNAESAPHGLQPAFDGMIATACELGISLNDFIEMARLARTSDPRVTRFLDAWDALCTSEQQGSGAADSVCGQMGLAPVELLRIVADVTCRIAIYSAQIVATVSHPLVVEKTVERGLTDEGIADRMALHKAMGFLPTPKTSRKIIDIAAQDAQATRAVQTVAAPRPEQTIRRLSARFNEARAVPRGMRAAFTREGNE